jgi:RecJ-like exonuclease
MLIHETCKVCNGKGKTNGSIVVREEFDGEERDVHVYLICMNCRGVGWVEV